MMDFPPPVDTANSSHINDTVLEASNMAVGENKIAASAELLDKG